MRSILKTAAMAAGILATGLIGSDARAGTTFHSDFANPGVSVNFNYTKLDSSVGNKTGVPSGAFKVKQGNQSSSSPLFNAYCASLNITNFADPADIEVINAVTLHGMSNNVYFQESSHLDVGDRLEFLLDKYQTISSQNEQAALQLATWTIIDKNFKVTGGSSSAVNSIFATYMANFTNGTYDTWKTSGTHNLNAVLLVVKDPPPSYQNLVGILPTGGLTPITPPAPAVPEPASVISALIGLGAAGLFTARRARNKKAA